ncbi:MAG: hypothetical protein A3K18_28260 [Lentisphaerae bacterium RIFOXYA12_64_32]|nr:MAG: hypothetical protein A3K18_28260 [Lentisphaerae bacterium RIFOXYA12_64_32]
MNSPSFQTRRDSAFVASLLIMGACLIWPWPDARAEDPTPVATVTSDCGGGGGGEICVENPDCGDPLPDQEETRNSWSPNPSIDLGNPPCKPTGPTLICVGLGGYAYSISGYSDLDTYTPQKRTRTGSYDGECVWHWGAWSGWANDGSAQQAGDSTSVTAWHTTGGSITSAGVLTAPTAPGTISITAGIDDAPASVSAPDVGTRDDSLVLSAPLQVTVVAVDRVQYRRGGIGDFKEIAQPLRVRLGEAIEFKAIPAPASAAWPPAKPAWGGTSGAAGTGDVVSVTVNTASTSATDYKTVTAECGNTVTVNVLVCEWVLGVHSTKGAGTPFLVDGRPPGHAWISASKYLNATQISWFTLGLWPDEHLWIQDAGLANGAGTDVRVSFDGENLGGIRRFFLLSPEEKQALDAYVAQVQDWTYWFTCASFAHDAVQTTTGIDVDADDILGFETPRELGEHIQDLEAADPTSILNPAAGTPATPSSNSFESWDWSNH